MSTAILEAPRDVNVEFSRARAQQALWAASAGDRAMQRYEELAKTFNERVRDGKLRNLGNGRYRVEEPGWDRGEILYLRETEITVDQAQGITRRAIELLPVHGLDMTTGKAALYSRVPAWHSLGTIVPEGLSDIWDVLQAAQLAWTVDTTPILYRNSVTGELETYESKVLTTRSDTGKALGDVGLNYGVFQNAQAFAFLEALVGKFGVTWESAGALRGGRRVFVCMRMPTDIRIDPGGINDEVQAFLVCTTTHDGTGKVQVMVTPWRPVCRNTERLAVWQAQMSWGTRHTRNVESKVTEARRTLNLGQVYYDNLAAEETELARAMSNLDDFVTDMNDFLGEVKAKSPAGMKKAETRRKNLLDELVGRRTFETKRVGDTLYASERAWTGYIDNDKPRTGPRGAGAEARADMLAIRAGAMLEGADDDKKSKYHKRLMLQLRTR